MHFFGRIDWIEVRESSTRMSLTVCRVAIEQSLDLKYSKPRVQNVRNERFGFERGISRCFLASVDQSEGTQRQRLVSCAFCALQIRLSFLSHRSSAIVAWRSLNHRHHITWDTNWKNSVKNNSDLIAVDRSGSMKSERRMKTVQATLRGFLKRACVDRLAVKIVLFDNGYGTWIVLYIFGGFEIPPIC